MSLFLFRWKDSYRKSNSFRTGVHTLHVHVRPEHGHLAVGVAVRLETFEETMRVVEDGGTRVQRDVADWRAHQS